MENTLHYTFTAPSPVNWAFLLAFWGSRAITGTESFRDGVFTKYVSVNDQRIRVQFRPTDAQTVQVICAGAINAATSAVLRQRIGAMLDIDRDIAAIDAFLQTTSGQRITPARLCIPGCFSLYEAAVRSVLGQQVSVKRAAALTTLFVQRCHGEATPAPFPEAHQVASSIPAIAEALPVTRNKKTAFIGLTEFIASQPDENARGIDDALTIKGVGRWTIDNIKLRGLRENDIWMGRDLVIQKMCDHLQINKADRDAFALRYAPYRSYLTLNLWYSYNLLHARQ